MATGDEKTAARRATVAPAVKVSKFLRHFSIAGDDLQAWQVNYKKWELEEEVEEDEELWPSMTTSDPEDRASGQTAAPGPAPGRPALGRRLHVRTALRKLFRTHKFQVLIICLVVLDALLVLFDLLLDMEIIQPDKNNYAVSVTRYVGMTILTFFMIEVYSKIYVFRLEFFQHKFEILDCIIVTISFILEASLLLFRKHKFEPLSLLILFRLWRVARIINGIIMSVMTHSVQQLLRLKHRIVQLATKIHHLELRCSEKEQEIKRLQEFLRERGLLGEGS